MFSARVQPACLTLCSNMATAILNLTDCLAAIANLKPLLVQIALSCGKSNQCPELKNKYLALKKRRGGKKAVIAIARKLLAAIWHILSKNQHYNADLYTSSDKAPIAREFTTAQAVAFLRGKGFVIVDGETGEVA